MALFYSASEGGFFDDAVHNRLPSDVVPVSQAEYTELLDRQSQGYEIRTVNGRPTAVARESVPVDPRAQGISSLEFRRRFTLEERGRITRLAAEANNNGDPTLQVFLDDLAAAGTVYLNDPEIVQGVEFCAARGLITPRRADAILGR